MPTAAVKRRVNYVRDIPATSLSCCTLHCRSGRPWISRSASAMPGSVVSGQSDGLPCSVVALGDDGAVASWSGPRPANVHLTGFVQQRALLPLCDLFVTHAGFGSIREALSAGIPMVSLPLNAEQPANAARLAELGIAVSLDAATATVETIAQPCWEVLGEPRYRDAAREWQRRTQELPGADVMVGELEAIAAAGDTNRAG